MSDDDLTITMTFAAPPETVFAFITERGRVLDWWGPESMSVPDEDLDFSRPGPWHSVFVNAEGKRYKVSGQVTEVSPPRAVAYTWGWHDETDARGPESRVRIELRPAAGGTEFVLTHSGLPDDASRDNHRLGWSSSLEKLARRLA
jgi:uncharacterized protein YndB with AHSA1/START domain